MAGIITSYTLLVNYRLLPSRLIIWLSHYQEQTELTNYGHALVDQLKIIMLSLSAANLLCL